MEFRIAAALRGAVQDLNGVIADAARAVRRFESSSGRLLGQTAKREQFADGEGGARLRQWADLWGDSTVSETKFYGADRQGQLREFNPDEVVSKPMRDVDGNEIGVYFPSHVRDFTIRKWAETPIRTADREFSGGVSPTAFARDNPELDLDFSDVSISKRSNWIYTDGHPAPWAHELNGPPVYVRARGDEKNFDIMVKRRYSPMPSRVVQVDGATYAGILQHNRYFQQALTNLPRSDVVLLTSRSAAPEGFSAKWTAESLHASGIRRTIHAPTGEVATEIRKVLPPEGASGSQRETVARLNAELPGDSESTAFGTFRPPGSANTPWQEGGP